MKQKKKQQALSLAGVFLIVVSLGAFVWYEWLGGRELINYRDVVVLTEDTLQGTIITKEKLAYVGFEKEIVNENAVFHAEDILGKAATHFIPKNTMLHENFFDETELVLKAGEYIAQIPVDWTISIPNTMRRGDNIIVYAATYDSEVLKELQQSTTTVSSSTIEEDGEEGQSLETYNPYFGTVGGPVEAIEAGGGELTELFHTTVAYARDSANQEVVTTSPVDRMNGSAAISNIEIITTPDEFEALEQQIKAGAKLIIMYSNDDSVQALTEDVEAGEKATKNKEVPTETQTDLQETYETEIQEDVRAEEKSTKEETEVEEEAVEVDLNKVNETEETSAEETAEETNKKETTEN